jgi:IMP dehydrogenase
MIDGLDYKDVYIVPQYSEVTSRSLVDTSVELSGMKLKLDVPVISANMDTVTDGDMAVAMHQAGALGAIHRFMTIDQNHTEFRKVFLQGSQALVSIGVNEDSKERASALYAFSSARAFVIDIAHGHSKMMKDMILWFRETFGNEPFLVAGNVATDLGAMDLFRWGADCVKIGIGPGNVCSTKNVTGVTVPQFSAVQTLCTKENKEKYETCIWQRTRTHTRRPLLIADGGITEIGDIAKALGAGADLVMCGRLFAACKEAPGPRINGKKIYRGMASRDAMLTIRDEQSLPAPEGISTILDESGETAASVVKHIKGGLQSAFSYSNAKNIAEFQSKVQFGLRRTQAR